LGATDDYPVVAVAYVFVVIVCKQIAEPELASQRNASSLSSRWVTSRV
jgi:hypothetical protein